MYITKYSCVFLKLRESTLCIYVAMDLIPILLGSLPLAHNAQHSLVMIHCAGVAPARPYNAQHSSSWGERERAPSCGLNGRAVTRYIYIDVRTFTATAHARSYAQT